LEHPDWNNSTVVTGDVLEQVSKLKAELEGDIVIPASSARRAARSSCVSSRRGPLTGTPRTSRSSESRPRSADLNQSGPSVLADRRNTAARLPGMGFLRRIFGRGGSEGDDTATAGVDDEDAA